MINFIHPYPAAKPSNQLGIANRSGSVPVQLQFSLNELESSANLMRHPEMMEDIERFPLKINMDHNEIARRLLDKVT